MKILVSPLEKDYVFKELDQSGIDYEKKEFTIYYCEDCRKLFTEKVEKCADFVEISYDKNGVKNKLIKGCGGTDIKSMSLGDIVGSKLNYCIERKKGTDLLHSCENDRIYFQLQAMKEVFKGNAALVFEGSFNAVMKKERNRVRILAKQLRQKNRHSQAAMILRNCEARIKQMLSMPAHCLSLGISFIQVDDLLTLIKMLRYFDYKCGEAPKIRVKKAKLSDLMAPLVKKLVTTEGIGPKLAARIFRVVQKPEQFIRILRHDPDRLLAVDKLGPKKLQSLKADWL